MNILTSELERLNRRNKITPEQRSEIIKRRLDGESQSSIAESMDIHQSSVQRIVARHLRAKAEEEGRMKQDHWMMDGAHECVIDDCYTGQYENESRTRFIHFTLSDEEGRICNKRFAVTDKSIAAIRSFGRACGLTSRQCESPSRENFIGKRVGVEIELNEDGYPVVEKWRRLSTEQDQAADDRLF